MLPGHYYAFPVHLQQRGQISNKAIWDLLYRFVQHIALKTMHLLTCQLINHVLHCHKLSVHVASFYFHPLIKGSDQCPCVRIMRPLSSFLWSPSVVDLIRHKLKQPSWGAAASCCLLGLYYKWAKHVHRQWGLWFDPLVKSGVKAEISRDTLM